MMDKKEAKKEAKRRWGETALVSAIPSLYPGCFVEASESLLSQWGEGETWEEAFADADRRERLKQN